MPKEIEINSFLKDLAKGQNKPEIKGMVYFPETRTAKIVTIKDVDGEHIITEQDVPIPNFSDRIEVYQELDKNEIRNALAGIMGKK